MQRGMHWLGLHVQGQLKRDPHIGNLYIFGIYAAIWLKYSGMMALVYRFTPSGLIEVSLIYPENCYSLKYEF
jgi:hypothetical protein